MEKDNAPAQWPTDWLFATLPDRNFLLVCDWDEPFQDLQEREEYETCIQRNDYGSEQPELERRGPFARATRNWDVARILGDMCALSYRHKGTSVSFKHVSSNMEARGQKATKDFDVPAVERGYEAVVRLLHDTGKVDVDIRNDKRMYATATGGRARARSCSAAAA
ncbi:hypothetical protein EK21DRAFT_87673 [Setomelanomma holmii]|uniref:Uncharacterized protein n=1 Tax=Setomelanomma holmii TaxID=210430 RepID=A0A9P4LPL2_9PLEO|nr:hypothetical protein EK21DRAFT_87673 [Setomelanomma holmii]